MNNDNKKVDLGDLPTNYILSLKNAIRIDEEGKPIVTEKKDSYEKLHE